ncbi:AAA domain-containing protein [Actinokineospora alba]|uniref:AAA domain-containing protein n=1 Tax=Actinokineospora alba TaxID=504798 RepID=A0A1H0WHP2_9PSEU|nr:ATP-binding protein [Actinokineospora alba]TDP65351.1 AAA domain-containing protein [Actinokineospora alba]SDH60240.1 AAA domain-containing protein [Actinokineospora alba]SDP90061.1 AAA domain-containing protein [Actinokineospora alba]
MEPVDSAFSRFEELRTEIADYGTSIITEADTRLKVIDRIFTEVLGWPHGSILTEDTSSAGFLDYNFQVENRSRLIVEAKKDERPLGVSNKPAKRGFLIKGPVFAEQAAREGIAQAIRYCGAKNAELACVTNGAEWIVFRGTRLGDGLDTDQGCAFIFGSLSQISNNFALFFDLLSRDSVRTFNFRPHFQEVEGIRIRASEFSRSLIQPGVTRRIPVGDLAADVDRVMATFFDRLTGAQDPELIVECFVETAESRAADSQLAKVSEDLIGKIRSLDTGEGGALSRVIERATQVKRHEFVVIVGHKGSGKSTFITRFFQKVLRREIARECISLRVNLADSTGDGASIVEWLDRHFLTELERALFGVDAPEFDELQGIFFDEYKRLIAGPYAALYRKDKNEFKIEFGRWLEALRTANPNEYIVGLVRHAVNSRKKLPVIVLDNADHFDVDFQQRVYQYARSIYEREVCLVIMPITDRTSWQLSKHGAFQSFEHETLFLPTPLTQHVLNKRVQYLHEKIENGRQKPSDRYFVKNGISLSLKDLVAFSKSLTAIFLETAETSHWIGCLANRDVRRALEIARSLVTSANLRVEDLLKAYLTGTAAPVSRNRVAAALIRGNYRNYPAGNHKFVQNVFTLSADSDASPLLGLRILQLLKDRASAAVDDDDYQIGIEEIIQYMALMGIDSRATTSCLDLMLKSGLVLPNDPTIDAVADVRQVEISPSGEQHHFWAIGNFEYLSAMADVTPILDEETYVHMETSLGPTKKWWKEKTSIFVGYLLSEDAISCTVFDHVSYEGQRRIAAHLGRTKNRLEDGGNPPLVNTHN